MQIFYNGFDFSFKDYWQCKTINNKTVELIKNSELQCNYINKW
jgi:hypothetical protein